MSGQSPSAIPVDASARRLFPASHKPLRILKAFGTIDFNPAYDYKAKRRRTLS